METDNRKLIAAKLAELDQLIEQCGQNNAELDASQQDQQVRDAFSQMQQELCRTRNALRAIYDDMQ